MSTPAGWYADPEHVGQQRYWDGSVWTEHRAPAAGPPVSPGQPVAPPAASQQGYTTTTSNTQGNFMSEQVNPKQANWFLRHKILSAILAVCVIGVIASAAGGGEKETVSADTDTAVVTDTPTGAAEPATAESKAPEPVKAKPKPAATAIAVTAGALLKEFEDNELTADAKYKGKTLKITGSIEKIDTEVFDENDYVLKLTDGGDFEFLSVDCYDIPNKALAKLKVGQEVTVIGKFKDGGDLGVTVNKCKVA